MRRIGLCCVHLAVLTHLLSLALRAQGPTVYTVTKTEAIVGPSVTMKIYRNGTKAVIDKPVGGIPMRTLYDLETHQSLSWDLSKSDSACGQATFSGEWGDPFAGADQMSADLGKMNAKQDGTETLNGFAANVMEVDGPTGKTKIWLEAKSGWILKLQMTPPGGAPQTLVEVNELSLAEPPASVFIPPSKCAFAPRTLSQAERIAAETGGRAQDFANAIRPPASSNACTVLFRIVRAGAMDPIASGFQVAVDPTVDVDHRASYSIGVSAQGHATFSGGGLRELTAQLRNGVLRIENAPALFDVEAVFGNRGSISALIYRQCAGPQTVLLLVVKNPEKLSDGGDWLWVKSGRYATVAP